MPEYLKITMKDRSCPNFVGFVIYKLYRFVYVVVWFYFLPFIATIVQYYFIAQAVQDDDNSEPIEKPVEVSLE